MKLSLIIATLNRPEELSSCLSSIRKQIFDDYEIIVIDQSDDWKVNMDSCEKYGVSIYKHIEVKGLSHARNVGINNASGDFIVLVDDDGFFNEDSLLIAVQIIEEKNLDILGAKIVDPNTGQLFSTAESTYISLKDSFKFMPSLGMIIRTSFIKKVLFDEDFGVGAKYGSGEETDIVINAISNGMKVYYSNQYIVNHPVIDDDLLPLEKVKVYTYGKGALCRKVKETVSRKWGLYFYTKSYLGNLIVGFIEIIFRKNKGKVRIEKAKNIKKGFKEYRVL